MVTRSPHWLAAALAVISLIACGKSGDADHGATTGMNGGGAASPAAGANGGAGGGGVGGGAVPAAGSSSMMTSGSGGRAGMTDGGTAGNGSAGGDAGAGGADGGSDQSDAAAPTTSDDVIVTIQNGDYWLDTDGNRIEAHGAGIIYTNGAWYWIGEDKSGNSAGFKGVNCYRSTDLAHWELRHAIITAKTSADLAAADRIIERPKVVYNETTKKYVMWLHWEGMNYGTAEAGVFTSDEVDGDYTQVRHFRPNNNMSRDDTLFADDDGKAYFLSASNNNADLALYELNADYTDLARQITTLWPGSYREAPAIMKAGSTYFIVNSGATNWDPNQQKYATASSMNGPWSSLSNVGDATGFDTQTAFIIPVKGSKTTTYIYAGDRWQDPDLKSSKYIWLPLKVSGNKLVLDYHESWQLNVTTGEWSAAGKDDGFIPQTDWKLVGADSEETAAEDGHAVNAFDGSPTTFWHTQYQDAKPPPPHEITIDLGASYSLTGMRYTPRNDGNPNGLVSQYELYVSDSSSNLGSAVKTGTFGTGTTPTTVTFTPKVGRYIRFRALSEAQGKAFTAVAEIDVAGTKM